MGKQFLKSLFLILIVPFSVCEEPIYIEAREEKTKKDWLGSDSIILHKVKSNGVWASGFSKDFG